MYNTFFLRNCSFVCACSLLLSKDNQEDLSPISYRGTKGKEVDINLRLPYGSLAALLAIKCKVWKERYGVLSPSWSSTFLRQGHIGITWDWQLWELFPIRKKKNMYFYHFCGNMKQWSYVKATDTEKDYVKICFLLWIYVKLGTNSVIT